MIGKRFGISCICFWHVLTTRRNWHQCVRPFELCVCLVGARPSNIDFTLFVCMYRLLWNVRSRVSNPGISIQQTKIAYDQWKIKVDELKELASKATTTQLLDEACKAMDLSKKDDIDLHMKTTGAAVRGLRGMWTKVSKALDKVQKFKPSQSSEGDNQAANLIQTDLEAFVTCDGAHQFPTMAPIGVGVGFAKLTASTPALLQGIVIQNVASELTALPYFSKQQNWLHKHMKANKKPFAHAAILEKPVTKMVADLIDHKLGVGNAIHNTLQIPSDLHSLKAVYEFQFYQAVQCQARPQCSPFCTAEARMMLEGRELVVGFRIAELPGASLVEKASHINSLTPQAFHELAGKAGFEVVLTEGTVLIVPAGYLVVIMAGSTGCAGLRWGLSLTHDDEADTPTVKRIVEEMITAYPGLSSSPLSDFKKFLSEM